MDPTYPASLESARVSIPGRTVNGDRTGSYKVSEQARALSSDRLLEFVNKSGFLAGRSLAPGTRGTMDVSVQWPLPLRMINLDFTAAAGTNILTVYQPGTLRHGMVLLLTASFAIGPAAASRLVMFIEDFHTPATTDAVTVSGTLLEAAQALYPLVRGSSSRADIAGAPSELVGVRAVYVPAGWRLRLAYTGAAAGDTVFPRGVLIDVPENQPLAALLPGVF